jgi:predicted aldo/keto reductase-like oxidoreductase
MDIDNQATLKGMKYAGEKGIPVVIMEGLLGGKLAKAPDNVQALYDAFPVKRSPVEWAFRWLCSQPEVATVLSGITNMEQCDDNLAIFDRCEIGCMTADEEELIAKVRDAYNSRTKIGCTGCRYCMPCPQGVDIPAAFSYYNAMYAESKFGARREYAQVVGLRKDPAFPSQCIGCGRCEKHCPQHISIIEELKKADKALRPFPYKLGIAIARKFMFRKST